MYCFLFSVIYIRYLILRLEIHKLCRRITITGKAMFLNEHEHKLKTIIKSLLCKRCILVLCFYWSKYMYQVYNDIHVLYQDYIYVHRVLGDDDLGIFFGFKVSGWDHSATRSCQTARTIWEHAVSVTAKTQPFVK